MTLCLYGGKWFISKNRLVYIESPSLLKIEWTQESGVGISKLISGINEI